LSAGPVVGYAAGPPKKLYPSTCEEEEPVSENYDSTWYDYDRDVRDLYARYGTNIQGGNYSYVTTVSSSNSYMYEMIRDQYIRYGEHEKKLPPPLFPPSKSTKKQPSDKEPKDMASTYGLSRDDQYEIDHAVREAIAAPKKIAEIATRKAAVEALGVEDNRPVGTVITFKRVVGKNTYMHVGIKADDEKWYVTGGQLTGNGSQSWDNLLQWMTTGENLVSDVQVSVSGSFTPVTWTVVSATDAAAPADDAKPAK